MNGTVESWSTTSSFRAVDTYYGPAHLIVNSNVDDIGYVGDDPSQQAITRLLSNVSLSKGSLGVGLAEAGKTAEHIAHTALRLANAFRALKKLRFREFTDALEFTKPHRVQQSLRRDYRKMRDSMEGPRGSALKTDFASRAWLEYAYGWRPLVQDVFDQTQNLANFLIDRSPAMRYAEGSAKTVKQYSEVTQTHPMWTNSRMCTTENRVRIGCWFTLERDPFNSFGINNPALIAWELVPFSFVVDWFLPIGNFLESLTATQGLSFQTGFKSLKRKLRVTSLHAPTFATISGSFGSADRQKYSGNVVGAYNQKAWKNRSVLTTFPSPIFPAFKDPRSFSHMTSAIALLQVVFLGKSTKTPSYFK